MKSTEIKDFYPVYDLDNNLIEGFILSLKNGRYAYTIGELTENYFGEFETESEAICELFGITEDIDIMLNTSRDIGITKAG